MTSILVIDDHPANREFLATFLGYKGYRVLEAADGADGLDQARLGRPDLVIADILMPTMDGYEFVRRLREDPAIAGTPVVFCTAVYHEKETRRLAERCGVSQVLTKPCEPEAVLQTVQQALGTAAAILPAPDKEDFDREHLRVMTDKLLQTVEELESANKRFNALIRLNLQFASEHDPECLLDGLCPAARDLIGARYAVLAVGDRNSVLPRYWTSAGLAPQVAGKLEIRALSEGPIGAAYRERRPLRLANPGGDAAAVGLPAAHPPVQAVLTAPIVSLKHVYGWICLGDRIGLNGFRDEDETLLGMLAAQVGRIYENGDLYTQIQKSEEKFRQIAEHIHEVFFLLDPEHTGMLYVSPAYEDIWGRSVESLYVDAKAWTEAIHPDDQARVLRSLEKTRETGRFDHEYRITRPDGEMRWIHARGFPIHDDNGNLYRVAGIADDVTRRRRNEDKIRRLNRVYAVLSGINTAIVRIRDRQELFEEACRILIDNGRFDMVWIGILDPETLAVTPTAWSGPPGDYDIVSDIAFSADERVTGGRTTIGIAIRERRPVSSQELDPGEEDISRRLSRLQLHGYRSIMSLPLLREESCLGGIVLYSKVPEVFDQDEMRLLTELTGDISFALDFIKNEQQVTYLAFHDPLTGLPNRTVLHRRLGEVIADISPCSQSCALVLTNINNFRDINYTVGHSNGDTLLKEIAGRVAGALSHSDMVACLGGDEFAILLTELGDKKDLERVVGEISEALQRPFLVQGLPVNVEPRLGIALCPDHGHSADAIWQHADIALSAARDLNRTWLLYDRSIDHYDPKRLTLLAELRAAMDRNELILHYQPTVNLRTGRVLGVEALLRWRHPEHGLLYPDSFISLVERTALIDALTTWVLANALRQGHIWHGDGLPLDISVNLSVRNLHDPKLAAGILDLVRKSKFPLECLTLEITESAIMADRQHARSVLTELHDAGIRLSLDDFGIGQSSLAYVRDLPISTIKIDKTFVIGLPQPSNAAIVRTAIELGHNLGLSVVAEGVEEEAIYGALRDLGCDVAQGYFLSKPLPPDELIRWIRDSGWLSGGHWPASS